MEALGREPDEKLVCFRQVESKVNLMWHQDNTISYQRRKYW